MEKYIYIYSAIEIDQRLIKQAKRCWRRHNVSLYCEDRFDSPLNHLGAILPHWFFARFRAFIVKFSSLSLFLKSSKYLQDPIEISLSSCVPILLSLFRTEKQFQFESADLSFHPFNRLDRSSTHP